MYARSAPNWDSASCLDYTGDVHAFGVSRAGSNASGVERRLLAACPVGLRINGWIYLERLYGMASIKHLLSPLMGQ